MCCWRLQWVSCSLPTRERVQGRDLLKPTEKSHCYHYITHVISHLLANLSHIRNEVTLTHPVSRVFQEPSRQRARFSTVQVCAIWILLLSFPWLKITLPQATPVPEGPRSVLLGTPVEHWQRVKTKSSSRVGDLWRRKQVYLKRAWSLLYFVFQDPYYDLFRIHLYIFPVFCKKNPHNGYRVRYCHRFWPSTFFKYFRWRHSQTAWESSHVGQLIFSSILLAQTNPFKHCGIPGPNRQGKALCCLFPYCVTAFLPSGEKWSGILHRPPRPLGYLDFVVCSFPVLMCNISLVVVDFLYVLDN